MTKEPEDFGHKINDPLVFSYLNRSRYPVGVLLFILLSVFFSYTMSDYSDPQLTPNGKVSKAKKGKPVHVCTECQKVYTRAEHLRRHQTSHQEPQYQCHICERRFHRRDLLERHFRRHEGETEPGQDDYQQ